MWCGVLPLSLPPRLCCVDTEYGKIGLGICYDLRFCHLSLLMGQLGCRLLVFPGAFNTTTGPPHWELLLRARALDSQVFVAGCSPARNEGPGYPTCACRSSPDAASVASSAVVTCSACRACHQGATPPS